MTSLVSAAAAGARAVLAAVAVRAWAAAIAVLALVAVTAAAPSAAVAQPAPAVGVDLIDQDLYVAPGDSFHVALQFSGAMPEGARMFVEVYPALEGGRSVFVGAGAGRFDSGTVPPGPLIYLLEGQYAPDETGRLDIDVTTVVTREEERLGRVRLAVDGVYPVRIAIRDDADTTLAELVTFVVRLPQGGVEGTLATAVVVPLDAAPSVSSDPAVPAVLDEDARARWESVTAVLEATAGAPLTVVPRPQAVAALRQSDAALTDRLAVALTDRQVLAPPYVDVDATALVAADLDDELTAQVDRGDDAISSSLPGVRPDRRTWRAAPSLDATTAGRLQALGVDQWIVPPTVVGSAPPLAEQRPEALATGRTRVAVDTVTLAAAAVPDSDLSAVLAGRGGRAAARRLEAELAFLWFQAPPGQRAGRGVVLEMPEAWTPDADLVTTFLNQLVASPLLAPTTVDGYFGVVRGLQSGGAPVVRTMAPRPADDLGALARDLRQAQSQLGTLSSYILDPDEPARLDDGLHIAVSADLSPEQRAPYFDRVTTRLDDVKDAIAPIANQTFTLTSSRAVLTVTLENRLDQDVQVRVQVSSSKLKIDKPDQVVVLSANAAEPVQFQVEALATGAFPLSIAVRSPDKAILMRVSTWTVRSTALSGAGWILSIGGLVFLGGWWVTHARRVRRATRADAVASGAAKARQIIGPEPPGTLDPP